MRRDRTLSFTFFTGKMLKKTTSTKFSTREEIPLHPPLAKEERGGFADWAIRKQCKSQICLVSFLLLLLWACSREKTTAGKIEPPLVRDAEVAVVQPESLPDSVDFAGTVIAEKTTVLSSKTVGTIVAVMAKEGDRVKKGQPLIEIDARDYRADLHAAQAALEEANSAAKAADSAITSAREQKNLAAATFKRYEPLVAKGSVTPQEFDEVRTKRSIAEAELARAEDNLRAAHARRKAAEAKVAYAQSLLSYTTIVSPFDGAVTAKSADIGALAAPGTPLMTVEQRGPYRLEVQVGETWLSRIKLGMAVRVVIDAINANLSGKVNEIVPAGDPQSRTFAIRIGLPAHTLLHSGLYGKAQIPLGMRDVLLVPAASITERGQLVSLYTVDDTGLVHLRLVTPGKHYDGKVEVLSGLAPGDRIVVGGVNKVVEGSRVALPAAR
jgi:membrane fusion protein, multidrug efflux system